MKILYGVQATGNGHITRARSIAPLLAKAGIEVDYLFSGRPADKLFDMLPFGNYRVCKGLTFVADSGQIKPLATFKHNSLLQFFREVKTLDTRRYDLVITDYEPITAWAAKIDATPSLGIGHQYAFAHPIPKSGETWLGNTLLKWFAPAKMELGVHWHSFNSTILPPIIPPVTMNGGTTETENVLVYLPFEETQEVVKVLRQIKGFRFHLHSDQLPAGEYGNVTLYPFSRKQFHRNLQKADSVLCNAGFELVSEALLLGKRIMVKPLSGQMEQLSNAEALQQLGLGWVIRELKSSTITHWLNKAPKIQVCYPDVAKAIVEWLTDPHWQQQDLRTGIENLSRTLWQNTHSPQRAELFSPTAR